MACLVPSSSVLCQTIVSAFQPLTVVADCEKANDPMSAKVISASVIVRNFILSPCFCCEVENLWRGSSSEECSGRSISVAIRFLLANPETISWLEGRVRTQQENGLDRTCY